MFPLRPKSITAVAFFEGASVSDACLDALEARPTLLYEVTSI